MFYEALHSEKKTAILKLLIYMGDLSFDTKIKEGSGMLARKEDMGATK